MEDSEVDEINQGVLFIADGARWIWKRVPQLVHDLGLRAEPFYELLDFYHASEHLTAAAKTFGWSTAKWRAWVNQSKKKLLAGKIEEVIAEIKQFASNEAGQTELNYFIRNKGRMNYQLVKGLGLPIGIGAIESAIRRVVNLKMKGLSIFWYLESANAMLLLRSFFKSGRWNLLAQMAFAPVPPAP